MVLEIGKLDSQPALGSGPASQPNYIVNRAAPGELEEQIRQFILLECLHT